MVSQVYMNAQQRAGFVRVRESCLPVQLVVESQSAMCARPHKMPEIFDLDKAESPSSVTLRHRC